MYFQMKNFVEVREPEGTLVFQLEDLMRYSGRIAPPEGGVNINSGVINVLLIGSDERENGADGSARADSIMMLSVCLLYTSRCV